MTETLEPPVTFWRATCAVCGKTVAISDERVEVNPEAFVCGHEPRATWQGPGMAKPKVRTAELEDAAERSRALREDLEFSLSEETRLQVELDRARKILEGVLGPSDDQTVDELCLDAARQIAFYRSRNDVLETEIKDVNNRFAGTRAMLADRLVGSPILGQRADLAETASDGGQTAPLDPTRLTLGALAVLAAAEIERLKAGSEHYDQVGIRQRALLGKIIAYTIEDSREREAIDPERRFAILWTNGEETCFTTREEAVAAYLKAIGGQAKDLEVT